MASRRRAPVKPMPAVSTQELRSQVALELLLNGYAIFGSLFVFRALFKALQVSQERWVGSVVYGITGIVADRLLRIPSADATLIGDMTLVDVTLLAAVVLFPLGLLMFSNRQER
jgi:hypothetical protein